MKPEEKAAEEYASDEVDRAGSNNEGYRAFLAGVKWARENIAREAFYAGRAGLSIASQDSLPPVLYASGRLDFENYKHWLQEDEK